MPQVLITESKLDNLAQQVSNKAGVALPLTIDEMATAVANISPNLQSKIVTPTNSGTTITPDSGYDGLSSVSVEGDSDLVANNIKHGVNIFGTSGTFGVRIDSVTTTPSERDTTITFTGLKAEPIAFFCDLEVQATLSNNTRYVSSVSYDGTTVRNLTILRSGGLITYKFTNCTFNYSNGSLTITSPSAGTNGYFHNGLHRLVYIYEE